MSSTGVTADGTGALEVREVDPTDDAAFSAWFGVLDAVRAELRPDEPGWLATELRAQALAGRPGPATVEVVVPLALHDGDATVGAAWLELPQRDNRHLAVAAHLAVLAGARRRGGGRRLVQALGARAAAAGARELVARAREGHPPDESAPGRAFARVLGFLPAQTDVQRDLDLPVDPDRLDALERACRPAAAGYRVVSWEERCPDHLVEDRALLGRRMSTDAPAGDVPLEEEEWDVARVRAGERLLVEQGRARLAAGAVVVATGRLVAFTELVLPRAAPVRAYQNDTLVLREHRGHRLGTWVKVANLRRAGARWPSTRVVSTWNADDNAPMIAVNDALGCRVAGQYTSWLRPVGPPG